MGKSNCCNADIIAESIDVCSDCKEHCEVLFISKIMNYKDKTYKLKPLNAGWVQVLVDDTEIAKVVNEEEGRRVIWLGLVAQGDNIKFIDDSMFEEIDL